MNITMNSPTKGFNLHKHYAISEGHKMRQFRRDVIYNDLTAQQINDSQQSQPIVIKSDFPALQKQVFKDRAARLSDSMKQQRASNAKLLARIEKLESKENN